MLHRLTAGRNERQVGLELGLSRHTVHDYVKELHRRFGVGDRAELLARAKLRPRYFPRIEPDLVDAAPWSTSR